MTAAELIEELKKWPGDYDVVNEEGYTIDSSFVNEVLGEVELC